MILAAIKKLGGTGSCADIRKAVAHNHVGITAQKITAEIKRMVKAKQIKYGKGKYSLVKASDDKLNDKSKRQV